MGFLFHGTGGGSVVVVVCCPDACDAPACFGWGRCLSKDCSSASRNGVQNGILPLSHLPKHPNVIPQSSVLSHLHVSISFLFSHVLYNFPWAEASTFNHLLWLHLSCPHGPSQLRFGGLQAESITNGTSGSAALRQQLAVGFLLPPNEIVSMDT